MFIKIRRQLSNSHLLVRFLKNLEINRWKLRFKINSTLAANRKSFLIATSVGENLNTLALDITLGLALASRGHDVRFALCDGGFHACMNLELNKFKSVEEFIDNGTHKFCGSCRKLGMKAIQATGMPIELLNAESTLLNTSERDVEIAESGAKRFLAVGRTENESDFPLVLQRFRWASIQFRGAIHKLLQHQKYDLVIGHHGIYVPQGTFQKLCKELEIPFVSWMQGYRKGSYVFSWNDTYHREFLKPFSVPKKLTTQQRSQIENYLASRDTGENDWIRYGLVSKKESINFNIDSSKPTAVLLTNVSWDAQLHYESRIFSDMHEWIRETILWFIKNPDCNLIVRIHPAEVSGRIKSRDLVKDFIISQFGELPPSIKVVGPEESISTYALFEKSKLGIIFGTKAGLEIAAAGIPLLIAGEAWTRNKGIGLEPKSKTEYFEFLERFRCDYSQLPKNQDLAMRVAYHYFFEKHITVSSISPISHYPYARPALSENWFEEDHGLKSIVLSLENQAPFKFPVMGQGS